MSRRRVTIHDYPEHLNPFREPPAGTSKYGTWSANTRCKIRQSIRDSTWIDALNLTPTKNKVAKKLFSFKSRTIDKFQRARSKSNAFEHTLQRPERRETKAHRTLFANGSSFTTSMPAKSESNLWRKSVITSPDDEDSEHDSKYYSQGAKPKLRKKRSAPLPPGSLPLNPDANTSVDIETFGVSAVYEKEDVKLAETDEKRYEKPPQPIATDDLHFEQSSQTVSNGQPPIQNLKPLIEQPNIAALVSNNLTL